MDQSEISWADPQLAKVCNENGCFLSLPWLPFHGGSAGKCPSLSRVFWTQMAFVWWDFIWIWSLIIFILGQGLFHGSSPYCLSPAAIARPVVNSSTLRTLGSHQTLGLQTLPLIVDWTRKQSHVSSNYTSQTLVPQKKTKKTPSCQRPAVPASMAQFRAITTSCFSSDMSAMT